MKFLFAAAVTSAALLTAAHADDPKLPLVFTDTFDKGLDHWQPSDPAAWKIETKSDGNSYSQFTQSKVKTPHRSPFNMSLVKDVIVNDFVLEATLVSTAKDGPHRDMCLFFGFQDPAHFYYAHLATKADDNTHHHIFIVNKADREKITIKRTDGVPWDDKWHKVKVVLTVDNGKIEVYFDDMKTPIMTATDKTFTGGQIGVGSFDDTGNWKNVVLHGNRVEKK